MRIKSRIQNPKEKHCKDVDGGGGGDGEMGNDEQSSIEKR